MPAMHNPDAIHSLKTDTTDFAGRPTRVLHIGDAALRLDDVLLLASRENMSDAELYNYLAHTRLVHDSPRPPLEALLHAFISCMTVMQSHVDATDVLSHTPAPEKLLRECFGDDVIVVPPHASTLQRAKDARAAMQANPNARGLVLVGQGLVTWGADTREAQERHDAIAAQAEGFVRDALERHHAGKVFAGVDMTADGCAARRDLALKITPILRGLLSRNKRVVLRYDNNLNVLAFLAQPEAQSLLQGTLAFLPHPDSRRDVPPLSEGTLRAHLESHLTTTNNPRIIVMPSIGMWTAGADLREATRIANDAQRIFDIMLKSQALGGYVGHAENPSPAPSNEPAEKELARRIALVTGAAHGIGKAIALRLAAEGAHVVVTDIDLDNAQRVADEIAAAQDEGRAVAMALDVTDEAQVQRVFDETVLQFGGLDVLVSNAGIAKVAAIADLSLKDWSLSLAINTTGHFLVSRAAMRVMLAQNIGGSIVFNATKNVTAPGKDFGAYSVAKAGEAQLCRILAIEGGPARIRANMVNPDAVLSSNLWSPEIREKRAKAQGIPVDQLEDFYTQRNLLKAKITSEDVAEAVFWLASDRASKTTGAMIPVDGGVREAFPR
jgi:NAD(P)-dependent dehydrogenase (short-subunit alcohol dehydrogenase family)/rhamnose utilization protein RhaD (predicted bifunctional aldolase and dehydrogenase)